MGTIWVRLHGPKGVEAFPNQYPDKELMLKLLEESAEAYSAWEDWTRWRDSGDGASDPGRGRSLEANLRYELADVLQCLGNVQAALDRTSPEWLDRYISGDYDGDKTGWYDAVRLANHERGRYEDGYDIVEGD